MLVVTICLSSCVTVPPAEVVVETYRPVMNVPPAPAYPSGLDWQYNENLDRYTIDDVGFRSLAEWRLRVEGYADQVQIIWSLIDDTP